MRFCIRFKLFLFSGILSSFTTLAQYDPGATASLGIGHGYTALSQSVMRNTFNSNSKSTVKAGQVDYVYLGSGDYSGFEEKITRAMMSANKGNDRTKIRNFLSSARTMHQFTMRSRAFGLKDTYLSDILATGIAWNWEMYHQTKASKQKVVEFRNAIKANLVKDGVKNEVFKLSAEEKKTWILSFMYNNSMLAQTIKQSGKISTLHKQQLAQTAKEAGIADIASVSLK